jgi:hypothetical protein
MEPRQPANDNPVLKSPPIFRRGSYATYMLLYAISGLVVLMGAGIGRHFFIPGTCTGHNFGFEAWFANWDGQWYNAILDHGYSDDEGGGFGSHVFFPLYPLLGAALQRLTGLGGELSLCLTSWLALLGLCLAWRHYAAAHPKPATAENGYIGLALLLFWPCAYFLRVDYTESLYLGLLVVFFLGIFRKWRFTYLVIICGLLTATRPTGILCNVVLLLHAWRRLEPHAFFSRSFRSLLLAAASAWGLAAYMGYEYLAFGDATLFLTKQIAWSYGESPWIFFERLPEMLSLRPVWNFLENGDWARPHTYPWIIQNHITFALAALLTAYGIIRRWLTPEETLYCCLSLALFYYYKAPFHMEAMGRYILSVLPIYLVFARILCALPAGTGMAVVALSACILFLHTGLYALMHCMY